MARKQNFYYVMVIRANGPVFVTSISRADKTAFWNGEEKPLELGRFGAEDLCYGLNLNGIKAYMICSKYELEEQPYLYDRGEFEWQDKEVKA